MEQRDFFKEMRETLLEAYREVKAYRLHYYDKRFGVLEKKIGKLLSDIEDAERNK